MAHGGERVSLQINMEHRNLPTLVESPFEVVLGSILICRSKFFFFLLSTEASLFRVFALRKASAQPIHPRTSFLLRVFEHKEKNDSRPFATIGPDLAWPPCSFDTRPKCRALQSVSLHMKQTLGFHKACRGSLVVSSSMPIILERQLPFWRRVSTHPLGPAAKGSWRCALEVLLRSHRSGADI